MMDNLEKSEIQSISSAVAVIVFTIITIMSFVLTGVSILFYALALLTIAVGFYMAYNISREGRAPKAPGAEQPAQAPRKQAKTRRRSA